MGKFSEKLVFSDRVSKICADIKGRIDYAKVRAGKFTRFDDDGKTPFLDVFERYPDEPYIVCLAYAIVESWMVSEPVIFDNDILIGFPRPDRVLHEHFSWGIQYEEDDDKNPDPRLELLKSRLFPLTAEHMNAKGREIIGAKEYDAATNGGLWWPGGYQGHTVPSYDKLLSLGIGGVVEQIDYYSSLIGEEDKKKADFYRACRIVLCGMSDWIMMHAKAAEELAEKETDKVKREQLKVISSNCRRVAWKKPETALEATQLTWFYSLWDSVDSLGRTDQYLAPFYKGHEDDDAICALIMKFWENGVHCITLGGLKPDGSDAVNELTYLILQILRTLHETHPRLNVRINENTPEDLLNLIVTMWSEGLSDPTVSSDKTVIDGLMEYGVSAEDARNFTILGCQEVEIPGKSNFGCEDGSINLAKILEYTLNHGRDRFSGVKVGLDTGDITDYKTFDELWDAFVKQVRYLTKIFIELCNLGVDIRVENVAKLVKSPLTEACIERGLNLDDGGAVYNFGVVETAGHAAVADSLYAMKTLVYDEKKISLDTLKSAIDADYKGFEDIRLMLANAPKFGNNDSGADEMTSRVINMFWSEIRQYKSRRGDVFMGACSLLEGGISYGVNTWALPDGRHAGEALGNTIGPRTGSDKNGLTAMLSSVSKLPLTLGVGGTSCNVLIPRTLMESEELKSNIADLIKTFMIMGGQLAQITTATLEDMKAAQINPEKYEDLMVRVGGFSARFVQLGRDCQDEIISRYAS